MPVKTCISRKISYIHVMHRLRKKYR